MKSKIEILKEFRKLTGVGMQLAMTALTHCDFDIENAIIYLRKTNNHVNIRPTTNGVIVSYITPDKKTGSMVEVNCETDFTAKTDEFITFAKNIAIHVCLNEYTKRINDLLTQKYINDEKLTILDYLNQIRTITKENINIKKCEKYIIEK